VAERTIAAHPSHPGAYRILAAALGQLGRTEAAGTALQRAITMSPQSHRAFVSARPPYFLPEHYEAVLDGLRKAGWTQ